MGNSLSLPEDLLIPFVGTHPSLDECIGDFASTENTERLIDEKRVSGLPSKAD
jgi:hypothetical protein